MDTRVDEIAPDLFRISTYVTDIAPPDGFTFNQFLVRADEPLLFHCGLRQLFPAVSAAVKKLVPLEKLRWITFGHVEADEMGAMNHWLAAAPNAVVAPGAVGCMVSINDLADRPPRALGEGEVLDLGGKRVRHLDTPHVPHGWDAGLLYEETTGTLLCGDLFTHTGKGQPLVKDDLVAPAMVAEDLFLASCLTPRTGPTIRRLAALKPQRLALMHGSSFEGDGEAMLLRLAEAYAERLLRDVRAARF